MDVIVTYSHFHDISRDEIPPEVFRVNENEKAEDVLRKLWTEDVDLEMREEDSDLDREGCWCFEEEGKALMKWTDGDTKEFFIVHVTDV